MLCCIYVSFQKANRLHITKTEIYVIFCTRVNIKLKKCVTVLIYDGLQRLSDQTKVFSFTILWTERILSLCNKLKQR